MKVTYTIGPIAAVAGSLLAQKLMNAPSGATDDLGSYAALYWIGVPCMLVAAAVIARLQLIDVEEDARAPALSYLWESFRSLFRSRPMLWLCAANFANNAGLGVLPNLSLHLRQATGSSPERWVGYVMALQFGFKSVSGYLYGTLAERRGSRPTLQVLQVVLALIPCWVLFVQGTPYVLVFALVGAAQLSGVYFPNYCLTISSHATGARNLSLLMIVSSLAGISSAWHGMLTDLWGAWASFCFGAVCAAVALLLVSKLPSKEPSEPGFTAEPC